METIAETKTETIHPNTPTLTEWDGETYDLDENGSGSFVINGTEYTGKVLTFTNEDLSHSFEIYMLNGGTVTNKIILLDGGEIDCCKPSGENTTLHEKDIYTIDTEADYIDVNANTDDVVKILAICDLNGDFVERNITHNGHTFTGISKKYSIDSDAFDLDESDEMYSLWQDSDGNNINGFIILDSDCEYIAYKDDDNQWNLKNIGDVYVLEDTYEDYGYLVSDTMTFKTGMNETGYMRLFYITQFN